MPHAMCLETLGPSILSTHYGRNAFSTASEGNFKFEFHSPLCVTLTHWGIFTFVNYLVNQIRDYNYKTGSLCSQLVLYLTSILYFNYKFCSDLIMVQIWVQLSMMVLIEELAAKISWALGRITRSRLILMEGWKTLDYNYNPHSMSEVNS